MEDIKKKMLCELENLIGHFEQRISKLEGEILDHKNSIDTLQTRCNEKNNTDLQMAENMKKVSIIKTLNIV